MVRALEEAEVLKFWYEATWKIDKSGKFEATFFSVRLVSVKCLAQELCYLIAF